MKNVIETPDELAYALHLRTGLARGQLARRIRFELFKLLPPNRLVNLYAHVKMLPAPPPHVKMRPLSPRDRAALHERLQSASLGDDLHLCATMCLVGALDPHTKALAEAIGQTVALEAAPEQSELIERLRAALLRCQLAAAFHNPRSKGGKKKAETTHPDVERRKVKARDLKARGWANKLIAGEVGKSESWVSRTLREAEQH